jgi:dTDP-4-dehydrorhamnose reductase
MRIVVTGAHGQVVRALVEAGKASQFDIITLSRPTLDLMRPETIAPALVPLRPDLVINAAAYTQVDQAETEEEQATLANAVSAGVIAETAAQLNVPVVQLSTDYVFDGSQTTPRQPDDPTGPLGVYGRTKLAGELAVAAANPQHVIVRTAWVVSPFGKNFVRTMLALAAKNDVLRVVSDQFGNPTSAHVIAEGLLALATRIGNGSTSASGTQDDDIWGTTHLVGRGRASWADLAQHVFATSAKLGGPSAQVTGIATSDWPTPAKRPANSQLDTSSFTARTGYVPPLWQESVEAVVTRLLRDPPT